MSVFAMAGKPMLIAPAPVVQIRSFKRTEHHGEGEHLVLGVLEDLLEVAALHAAEGDAGAGRPVQGVDGMLDLGAERHEAGVPAELHALPEELLGHAVAVHVAAHEGQDVLLLEIAGDLDGLVVVCRPRR